MLLRLPRSWTDLCLRDTWLRVIKLTVNPSGDSAAIGGLVSMGTYQRFAFFISSVDSRFISYVASAGSIGNMAGRVVWGGLSDHWGPVNTLPALSLTLSALLFTWSLSGAGRLDDKYLFGLWYAGESPLM
jgi:MFS family permease